MSFHGMKGTKVYNAWIEIKRRCYNPDCKSYKNYGGRGILFEEYKDDFILFLNEVGEPPSELHSINRINNSLGYIKGNMNWVSSDHQARNRRRFKNNTSGHTGVSIKYSRGKAYILAQWSDLDRFQKSKSFSVEQYGYEQALQIAVDFRANMIEKLNEKGASYGSTHGQ